MNHPPGARRHALAALLLASLAACDGTNRGAAQAAASPVASSTPIAEITAPEADPIRVPAGQAVMFAGRCSDPAATAHAWTFEGGFPAESDAAEPTVVFPEAGTHPVSYACRAAGGSWSAKVARTAIVLAAPDPASTLEAVSLATQTGAPGEEVGSPPAVRVRGADGAPVAGTAVTFTVTEGGGTLAGAASATAVSDPDGLARVAAWTLGTSGAQQVQASAEGTAGPATFTAALRTPTSGYDITLRFLTTPTEAQRLAFEAARERIEAVVTGDLPGVRLTFSRRTLADCGGVDLDEDVDDLLILVDLSPIDGPYRILGQAGPCVTRGGSDLPALGIMQFDTADLAMMEQDGQLGSVILHEMLHVVGFGTIWSDLGLLEGAGQVAPYPVFTGGEAAAAFASENGAAYTLGPPVPVEDTGGAGTAGGHWREKVFENELMTGWLSGTVQPMSATTIGSLADLGYTVDLARADRWAVGYATAAPDSALSVARPERSLAGDVRQGPIHRVDVSGPAAR